MDERAIARDINEAVAQLFFSAETQQRFHGAADDLGLSPPMLKALLDLEPDSSSPMRDLAEQWNCDASFVTVIVDGLEARGFVERRVADHDRRIKTVALTDEGVAAREKAGDLVFGPRAVFATLTPSERRTLARLLRRLADAQAAQDKELLDEPQARAGMRRFAQQRVREGRGRGGPRNQDHDWRVHLEQHREELRRLKAELGRVRAEVKAQARRSAEEVKAAQQMAKDQAKAAKDEAKAAARSAVGGRRPTRR